MKQKIIEILVYLSLFLQELTKNFSYKWALRKKINALYQTPHNIVCLSNERKQILGIFSTWCLSSCNYQIITV